MRMRKKGQAEHEGIFIIFEILLAISVVFFLTQKISNFKDNTIFDKNFLARDVALTLNTLSFAPGNAEYHYLYPKLSFDISFTDKITVSDKEGSDITYPFMKNKGFAYSLYTLSSPTEIFFSKAGNEISFQNLSLNRLPCIPADPGKIAVDFDTTQNRQELGLLAQSIQGTDKMKEYSNGVFYPSQKTFSGDTLITVAARKRAFDYIKVYSSPEEKNKACSIANAVVDAAGISASVIPDKEKGSMRIELGISQKGNDMIAALAEALS